MVSSVLCSQELQVTNLGVITEFFYHNAAPIHRLIGKVATGKQRLGGRWRSLWDWMFIPHSPFPIPPYLHSRTKKLKSQNLQFIHRNVNKEKVNEDHHPRFSEIPCLNSLICLILLKPLLFPPNTSD